ncbi:hypothetical protein HDV05_002542 [Chytridiales sp. JEL 0842]|nr:hypothetical protein HDV05_002542 [Chytridiales sp. JEL 0842]
MEDGSARIYRYSPGGEDGSGSGGGSDTSLPPDKANSLNGSRDDLYEVYPEPATSRICGMSITRRRKLFLLLCISTTLIFLSIFTPLIIFVFAPRIAQTSIESSSLMFTTAGISNASSGSFIMSAEGSITNAGFLDAVIDFPDPIKVFWTNFTTTNGPPNAANDILLGTLTLPPLTVQGSTPKSGVLSVSNALFVVSDLDSMSRFTNHLLTSPYFSWKLSGTARAKALGLSFSNLFLEKTVTLAGFNGLPNVTITQFDLPSPDPVRGIKMNAKSVIMNPSSITVDLGTLFFNSTFKGRNIGTLQSAGGALILKPGLNEVDMAGALSPMDERDTQSLSEVFTMFVGGRGSRLEVVGTGVVPAGGGGVASWLNRGFSGLRVGVDLAPPTGQRALVSDLKVPSLSIAFDPTDPTGSTLLATAPLITTQFNAPFPFPISILGASQNLTLFSNNTPFALLTVPFVPAQSDQASKTLTTGFSNALLKVVPGTEPLFAAFLQSITFQASTTTPIQGLLSSQAQTPAGIVSIADVPLTDTLTVSGFQGLQNVQIQNVAVLGGDQNGIQLQITTVLENPGTMTLVLNADMQLDLFAENEKVGAVVLSQVNLHPGPNVLVCRSTFNPTTATSILNGRKLLSSFMGGGVFPITLGSHSSSTPYTLLNAALEGLRIPSTLPGQRTPLLSQTFLKALSSSVVMEVSNPLDSAMTVDRVKASIYFKGSLLGIIDEAGVGLQLLPKTTGRSKNVGVQLRISLDALRVIPEVLTGNLRLDVVSEIGARVGGYPVVVDYQQPGVATAVQFAF